MSRHDLTIAEWNAIRNYLPKKRSGKRGRPWVDHRKTINGIIWVLNAGAPWRDIPDCYGKWQTIYKRFRTWCQSGLWDRIWDRLIRRLQRNKQIDPSIWCVDGSIVRAHHSAVGGSCKTSRCAVENGLGRSRGPKGTPEKQNTLTHRNIQSYLHYLECKAVGAFPDDPIVRRNARLIQRIVTQSSEKKRFDELVALMGANRSQ